jgi:hypothetical protein
MTIEERFKLFGDPTASLVAEAVFRFWKENDGWPLWEEAVGYRSSSLTDPCDQEKADRLLREAIANGEVVAVPIRGGAGWWIKLTEDMAARIERRYIDMAMPRRDKEETW